MNKYTAQAGTVVEAVQKALKLLGINESEAIIEVVNEGKKGIFGIGKKDATVTVTKKVSEPIDKEVVEEIFVESAIQENDNGPSEPADTEVEDSETDSLEKPHEARRNDEYAIKMICDYLENIVQKMEIPGAVTAEKNKNQVIFHIETEKVGLIIGKHGKVLNALQSLAQVLLHRHARTKYTAIVNAGDYRERRETALVQLAERTAEKVHRTNQPVFLDPMPAFERKQIHFYLSKDSRVATHSEGNEPHRYLVVEPAKRSY